MKKIGYKDLIDSTDSEIIIIVIEIYTILQYT